MCQAMDEIRADCRAEGRAEGILSAIRNIMKSMKLSAEEAMDVLLVPKEDREKYLAKL